MSETTGQDRAHAGEKAGRAAPRRTCVATREVRSPDELVRFVASPDGVVTPDLKRKLPGRGVWVSARREAVETAVKRRLFARGLKASVTVPEDLAAAIDAALVEDLRQGLALANKAGRVVTGFDTVVKTVGSKTVVVLVHASEAAEDGKRKIAQALRRRLGDASERVPIVTALAGHDLDLALGRSHVIHAALVAGAGSRIFLERWRRLCVYRGTIAMNAAPLDPEGAGLDDETNPQDRERNE
ncbi:RNA-binding protein [Salinarimonas ramus]|uniref:DNA-binding protein n=1 Tax=Salinarimonas ramus TaxID=690164 RepID=A0A917V3V3_9HYPH|nr:RNA-binding protein [Salinarimonas ramus]GGK33214.1 DNA-binding protein [Salinarimonas ramus]